MGLAKNQQLELAEHIEGNVGDVALGGGYLYIYQADALLHIASIPSPNLLAERSSDSVVENVDEFEDTLGNQYLISIASSISGIYWRLEERPDDESLLMQLHYEIKLNEE